MWVMERKLVGVIEKVGDGGYGIYALEDVIPVTGYGLTEEEAKKNFVEQIKEQADYYKEKKGTYPEWYEENLEVEYRYDMSPEQLYDLVAEEIDAIYTNG